MSRRTNEHLDAVFLGARPGGEVALNTLARAGLQLNEASYPGAVDEAPAVAIP